MFVVTEEAITTVLTHQGFQSCHHHHHVQIIFSFLCGDEYNQSGKMPPFVRSPGWQQVQAFFFCV